MIRFLLWLIGKEDKNKLEQNIWEYEKTRKRKL